MRENKAQGHSSERRSPCEINHLFGGASCVEAAKEKVDGLLLCERHALEAKLEGQISCWGGMLFHIDLWSREASRREREDVVGLLEDQRDRGNVCQAEGLRRSGCAQEREPWERRTEPEGGGGALERLSPSSSKRRPAALSRASTSST